MQQLILIGDHKQLRPKPTSLKMNEYNLHISLFERMVKNQIAHDSLEIQHRMRPQIADLVRWIYKDQPPTTHTSDLQLVSTGRLIDDEKVKSYDPIRGVQSDIFFLNHDCPEQCDIETNSHFNPGSINVSECYS